MLNSNTYIINVFVLLISMLLLITVIVAFIVPSTMKRRNKKKSIPEINHRNRDQSVTG
jgi:hypothetical protein